MNKRIRELIEQSYDEVPGWDATMTVFNKEKFAMLIVEECRNVLADVYSGVPLECCGHFLHADEILAKHFYGVEE